MNEMSKAQKRGLIVYLNENEGVERVFTMTGSGDDSLDEVMHVYWEYLNRFDELCSDDVYGSEHPGSKHFEPLIAVVWQFLNEGLEIRQSTCDILDSVMRCRPEGIAQYEGQWVIVAAPHESMVCYPALQQFDALVIKLKQLSKGEVFSMDQCEEVLLSEEKVVLQ